MIEPALSAVANKFFIIQAAAKNLPEGFGANGFFMKFFAKSRFAKGREPYIRWRNMFGQ
jgi:hypothetical protein